MSNDEINIAFILDEGFTIPTATAITSLIENKEEGTFYTIYLVTSNLSDKSIKNFHKYASDTVSINVIKADTDKYKNFHKFDNKKPCCATPSALLKFELPNLLADIDKVLYLDGDILVLKDLSELYATELDENYLAAVKDSGRMYYKTESTKHIENYFNSGVMLLNLKKMRENNMTEILVDAKRDSSDMSLMDQNIFNIVFEGKVKFLDIKYNFLYLNLTRAGKQNKYTMDDLNSMFDSSYSNLDEIKEKACIIHFSSKDKPWKYSNIIGAREWLSYYKKSYFYDENIPIQNLKKEGADSLSEHVEDLVVSLTSYPARIGTVNQTIESLLNQTIKAEKVVLWLAPEQFPNKEKDLPKQLLDLVPKGLTIDWYKDIKSYKKLIPALIKYPDKVIVTADDDIIYEPDRIEKLYKEYLQHPEYIHCHRAHRIWFSKGKLLSYDNWKQRVRNVKPSYNNFFTGAGCVLYPPNCSYKDILKEDLFMELAPDADDIWFWAMAVLNGTKINVVKNNNRKLAYVEGSQETGLWYSNVLDNKNDVQLKNVLNYYPKILKRLDKNNCFYGTTVEKLFSIKNSNIHKIITFLGLKFKFKSKKLLQRQRFENVEKDLRNQRRVIAQQKSFIDSLQENILVQQETISSLQENTLVQQETISNLQEQIDKKINNEHKIISNLQKQINKKLNIEQAANITEVTMLKTKYHWNDIKIPIIKNNFETIQELINSNKSIIRFGDGEFNMMEGNDIVFQSHNFIIAEKLKEIFKDGDENLMVGVPEPYYDYSIDLSEKSKSFILGWFAKWHKVIEKYYSYDKTYYSTHISQMFPVYSNYDFESHYSSFRQIWDRKKITIVTGDRVYNNIEYNIFENASEVSYIYGPTENAFDKYEELKSELINVPKDHILIFALGPAGKVLAYDMYKLGYRVLDLGHLIKDYDFYKKSKNMSKEEWQQKRLVFFEKD